MTTRRTAPRADGRRGTPSSRMRLRAPPAVQPNALARPARPVSVDDDLELDRPPLDLDRPGRASERALPGDQLEVLRSSVRAPAGKEDERLEEVGLARRVGPPQDLRARAETDVEGRVAAQVRELDAGDEHARRTNPLGRGAGSVDRLTRRCGPA